MKNAFGRDPRVPAPERPSIGTGASAGESASIRDAQLRNRSIEDPEARIAADRAAVERANEASRPK
jgi:hypothetical protein